ncbi:MAG: hypothetical protein BMS9Abin10_0154 [Gammaproteobacteria bacterium]|nr:MAG: hypothetical protein BMS9Abin10_0154 [Gammaproteobacteria bacterium]
MIQFFDISSDFGTGIPHRFRWHNICSEELYLDVEVFQLEGFVKRLEPDSVISMRG